MARVSFPGRDGINVPVRGQILKSTGDTYYENFVVTPKGSIYRTLSPPRGSEKKRNTDKSHESHESACKRQRSAE